MNVVNKKLSPEISIIIPVYDEAENIEILVNEIRNAIDPLRRPFEIIFIDDGSKDQTLTRLKNLILKNNDNKSEFGKLKIIRFTRNFGQAAAMQAGFDQAAGEIIVSMDGDLQNDPADIPKLLDKMAEGYDMVCGWRKHRRDKTFTRIAPSVAANWIIRKLTGIPIHDNGCTLKAYKDAVIKTVKLYSDMHRFIPAMVALTGVNIAEIIVNHRPRRFGKTKYGLSRIWKVLFDMITIKMLLQFYSRPLWWFTSLGITFLFIGFGLGIASILILLKGKLSIVFFTACILFIFLFASLLSWGILAEYFIKIEKRPSE